MAIKILGGTFRGRTLQVPRVGVRPTLSLLREAFFSILGPQIEGACILDLFAGTGAIGLEALSRGAREVLFVDLHTLCLKQNIATLGVESCASILRLNATEALRVLMRAKRQFDIVFADPPYRHGSVWSLVESIFASSLLRPGGLCFVEERSGAKPPPVLPLMRERRYGGSTLFEFSL